MRTTSRLSSNDFSDRCFESAHSGRHIALNTCFTALLNAPLLPSFRPLVFDAQIWRLMASTARVAGGQQFLPCPSLRPHPPSPRRSTTARLSSSASAAESLASTQASSFARYPGKNRQKLIPCAGACAERGGRARGEGLLLRLRQAPTPAPTAVGAATPKAGGEAARTTTPSHRHSRPPVRWSGLLPAF